MVFLSVYPATNKQYVYKFYHTPLIISGVEDEEKNRKEHISPKTTEVT